MYPLQLSLTTYPSAYYQWYTSGCPSPCGGPFDLKQLASTNLAQLNVQDYTDNKAWFSSNMSLMYTYVPSVNWSKIQFALGDFSGANPPIAGYCLKEILGNSTQSIAIWPSGGGIISDGSYGYSDTIYQTTNWVYGTNSWYYYYVNHVT